MSSPKLKGSFTDLFQVLTCVGVEQNTPLEGELSDRRATQVSDGASK